MTDNAGIARPQRAPDPYIFTPHQRRVLAATAACLASLYFAATTLTGPTDRGRVIDSVAMAAVAASSLLLGMTAARRVHRSLRTTWVAFSAGVGFYSIAFGFEAARWRGCRGCESVAAYSAIVAWASFGILLLSALSIAYQGADIRLWVCELLDGLAVLSTAAFWVGLMVELELFAVPPAFASVEFIELVALPFGIAGFLFALRSISADFAQYKALQLVFLFGVCLWIATRSWNGPGDQGALWAVFAFARAVTVFSALTISGYGIAPGTSLDLFNVRAPEERPVTDVSLVVGVLAVLVVSARIAADSSSRVYALSLPILALVGLLLVVRLALTSEYQRHLETIVINASARYRDLVEEAQQGILEIDEHGAIRYSNEAAAEILGVDRKSLEGKQIGDMLTPAPPESIGLEPVAPPSEYGESVLGVATRLRAGDRVVARLTKSSGRVRYVELAPSAAGGREPVKTLLRDVTTEIEQRIRVQNLIKGLQEKNAERSALMRQMLETAESERYSIASQLHDGPVQHLTLLALKTDLLRRRLADGVDTNIALEISSIAAEVASEAANLTDLGDALSPQIAADEDVGVALESMMNSLFGAERARGPVVWKVAAADDLQCSATTKIALYRALQAVALDARTTGTERAEIHLNTEGEFLVARFITDAPLDTRRARGVARAKVWIVQLGGSFAERHRESLYEAELRLPRYVEKM